MDFQYYVRVSSYLFRKPKKVTFIIHEKGSQMIKWFCLVFCFLVVTNLIKGQSPNVNCESAFEIQDARDWCSEASEFDNTDAGESEFEPPECFDLARNDLWFSFIATSLATNISIDGQEFGDLSDPQVALYEGDDCGFLIDLGVCDKVSVGDNLANIFTSGLKIGQKYYIRVDGRRGKDGTFQLCIRSYDPPVEPGQDCVTAAILCSKDQIVVQQVDGGGDDPDEAPNTCIVISGNSERASTWFKWTAATSGTLTFDIKPLLITNDIDFILYRLINGVDDCEREILRCNGTDGGDYEPCGPNTGLNMTSTDLEEDPNCDPGEDGYLRFLDMVEGESYALLINNFNDKGGFTLEFGGTGEFFKPEFDFDVEPLSLTGCTYIYNAIVESDLGDGAIYNWDFGPDADPQQVSGPSPQQVIYNDLSEKSITVTYVSEFGCQVTETMIIPCEFEPEFELVVDEMTEIDCGTGALGAVKVSAMNSCASIGYEFSIDGGPFNTTGEFNNLTGGEHEITVLDENNCEEVFPIFIEGGSGLGLDIEILEVNNPGCDKIYTFQEVIQDGDAIINTISWDFGPNSDIGVINGPGPHEVTFSGFGTQAVSLFVTDDLCQNSITERLDILPCSRSRNLTLQLINLQDADCNNEGGEIIVGADFGCPPYLFSINEGPFVEEGIFSNLSGGTYQLKLKDADECEISETIVLSREEIFSVDLGDDVTIFRPGDTVQLSVMTTAMNIIDVSWTPQDNFDCSDGSTSCLDPIVFPFGSTDYTVTITDNMGCVAMDRISIIVDFDPEKFIYSPNVFSPNEDGINDVFTIFADARFINSITEFIIFDRWGNRVYEGFNLNPDDGAEGWDGFHNGDPAIEGVYTWFAGVLFTGNIDVGIQYVSGNVTLIR